MLLNRHKEASSQGDASGRQVPRVEVRETGDGRVCTLSGDWETSSIATVDADMRRLEEKLDPQPLILDLSGVSRFDTAGAWLVERLAVAQRARGGTVSIEGAHAGAETLIAAVRRAVANRAPAATPPKRMFPIRVLEAIGRAMYSMRDDFVLGMHILGATIRGAQLKMGRGHAVNPAAIFHQIDRMGVGAIGVVVLMSFIVGAIVAQQGAFQLRYFGAEILVVDLVAILVLRELGVLMTAIMVAGRTGSAITAEIGSMKMREEVDALTVIGLNPVGVLVFPRLVALVIALPCLTVIANFAAIGGAMVVAWSYSGIPPETFLDRMRESIGLNTIFAGLVKAPFMALIIGIIASVEGMKVGGSAESLGQQVTSSVVKAIFIVVILDGLFAMFFAAINF
ncbi:MAG: MlaE family lipid ABC transporter permease subunit [Rhizobiaceae bacterium]